MRHVLAALIVLVIVASCDADRGYDVDESIYKIPNQDKALLYTERAIEDHYNTHLGNTFENTTTHFVRGEVCPYNGNTPAMILDSGQCVAGIMYGCQEMYVAIMPQDDPADYRACGTALLHEFGHCLLMTMQIDPDANHTNSEFWGIVSQSNKYTCGRGW